MEPLAYGLLAPLKSWEWEEMLARSTVAEIEQTLHGVRWRDDALLYGLAWQTAHLLNAAGSKPRSAAEVAMLPPATEPAGWTAEKLLGRPPMALDPAAPERIPAEAAALPDGRPDWDEATRREKAERARLMIALATAKKATD